LNLSDINHFVIIVNQIQSDVDSRILWLIQAEINLKSQPAAGMDAACFLAA
jgi:hypothetical protein